MFKGNPVKDFFNSITTNILEMERTSAVSLFVISIFLSLNNIAEAGHGTTTYIWAFAIMFISVIQFVGIKNDVVIMRLIGSWFSFVVWTWLSFASINIFVCIVAFLIGMFNIVAFISLTNRIQFDWIIQKN